MSTSVGLRLKQLVLLFGAVFLGIVALTNLMNLVSAATTDWTFLNSHNTGYVESVVAIYDAPGWLDEMVVLAALAIEAMGAVLFVRALLAYRGGGTGVTETYQALAWNIGVWFAFIVGSEVFLAYDAEGTFRELLALALLMAVVIAVVPDEPAS